MATLPGTTRRGSTKKETDHRSRHTGSRKAPRPNTACSAWLTPCVRTPEVGTSTAMSMATPRTATTTP